MTGNPPTAGPDGATECSASGNGIPLGRQSVDSMDSSSSSSHYSSASTNGSSSTSMDHQSTESINSSSSSSTNGHAHHQTQRPSSCFFSPSSGPQSAPIPLLCPLTINCTPLSNVPGTLEAAPQRRKRPVFNFYLNKSTLNPIEAVQVDPSISLDQQT